MLQFFNLKSSQYFVLVKKRLYKRLYCIRDCIVKREKIFFEMNLYSACCGGALMFELCFKNFIIHHLPGPFLLSFPEFKFLIQTS